jgi:hypothetical protein
VIAKKRLKQKAKKKRKPSLADQLREAKRRLNEIDWENSTTRRWDGPWKQGG